MTEVVSTLTLTYIDGKTWTLADDFAVRTDALGLITVPKGFRTDFNSIPRGLWNLLPPDEWGHAAVAHDHLYKTGRNAARKVTRGEADSTHYELAMFDNGGFRARMMYWGLRAGGWKPWGAYRALDLPPVV